ncbi:MAG: EAL domain-containing protein [Caldimicrobium sp.]|nr:EAL domain-containing protein [Caldimicrobium sp.]MCX7613136.1 EAL domain-containing protein [Caldimicrobium sp.]MDW8183257.1 EAL domain-containing protein [Caldimicrobium sp.]
MIEKEKSLEEFLSNLHVEIFSKIPFDFQSVDTHFQPLIDLTIYKIIGYEALTRPLFRGKIDDLYKEAIRFDVLSELDLYFRIKALYKAYKEGLDSELLLFLNVHPKVLSKKHYYQGVTQEFLRLLNFDIKQIVLEISECEQPEDLDLHLKTIFYYLNQGYQISIDDYGIGSMGYLHLVEIKPSFIKLDQYFVPMGLEDSYSRSFIEHTSKICRDLGVRVVAKGVERREEVSLLLSLGINYFQGYYFGKPTPSLMGGDIYEERKHKPKYSFQSFAYF